MNDELLHNNPALYAELWKEYVAAAIVQRMVRGHMARKMVASMRQSKEEEYIFPACSFISFIDEENNDTIQEEKEDHEVWLLRNLGRYLAGC